MREADDAMEAVRSALEPPDQIRRPGSLLSHPFALEEHGARAPPADHAPIQLVEPRVVARRRDREPIYDDAADGRATWFVCVRPVDVRVGAGGGHLDVMTAPGHTLGHLPAVLLGTTRDRLAVPLYDVEQAHQTTSRRASTTAASVGRRSSSTTRRFPAATNSRRRGSFTSNSPTASANSS